MLTRKMRTGIIISLLLACVVFVGIGLYGDLPRMIVVLAHFRWRYLPLVLGLTLFNYFWRFMKWHYYLNRLGVELYWWTSLLIFISGLTMAITPGKVGELLKSFLVKHSTGATVSRTAPIIVAERVTDGIAMLGLAATGLVLYHFGWGILLTLLVIGIAMIIVIQNRRMALALLRFGERLPILARAAHHMHTFYESSYTLFRWRLLLLAILIGFISWLGECTAVYFIFRGLGFPPSFDLLLKSTAILAISSLIGSASGLPGGLGTADGSILGMVHILLSPSAAIGGAATVMIRLCTLWFGVGVGAIALLIYRSTAAPNLTQNPPSEPLQSAQSL